MRLIATAALFLSSAGLLPAAVDDLLATPAGRIHLLHQMNRRPRAANPLAPEPPHGETIAVIAWPAAAAGAMGAVLAARHRALVRLRRRNRRRTGERIEMRMMA